MLHSTATTVRILTVFLSLTTTLYAQTTTVHGPEPDAWALQFSVGPNFSIGSFTGSMLSIKKHTSSTSAWRLGVGLNGNTGSSKENHAYGIIDSTDYYSEGDRDAFDIDLNLQYVSYFGTSEDIHVFFGIGPRVYYKYVLENRTPTDGMFERESYSRDEVREIEAGITCQLGVEWFFADAMSLSAEYGGFLGYQRESFTYEREKFGTYDYRLDEREREGLLLSSLGARLGLSVYF